MKIYSQATAPLMYFARCKSLMERAFISYYKMFQKMIYISSGSIRSCNIDVCMLDAHKEDLIRMVISYKMAMSVRFCLSYDPLQWDFIAFKLSFISIFIALLTRTLSMTLHVRAKVLLHVWSYDFYDTTLPTE